MLDWDNRESESADADRADEETKAFDAGAEAYDAGKAPDDNPHYADEDEGLALEWEHGFNTRARETALLEAEDELFNAGDPRV